MVGNISLEEYKVEEYSEEIKLFEGLLKNKEKLNSGITINSQSKKEVEFGKLKDGLNKLIS